MMREEILYRGPGGRTTKAVRQGNLYLVYEKVNYRWLPYSKHYDREEAMLTARKLAGLRRDPSELVNDIFQQMKQQMKNAIDAFSNVNETWRMLNDYEAPDFLIPLDD